MTPQSEQPRRQSDRIKQNVYPVLNFNIEEDFPLSSTTQTQPDEANPSEERGRPTVLPRPSDSRDSSPDEGDEPQARLSRRLLWPPGSRTALQKALTIPSKSPSKPATLKKANSVERTNRTRSSRSGLNQAIPDAIKPDPPTGIPWPVSPSSSESDPVDSLPLENAAIASPSTKGSTAKKTAPQPRNNLDGSKCPTPHKQSRLNFASDAAATTLSPVVDNTENRPGPSSKDFKRSQDIKTSQDPVAVVEDYRSPTLAAQSFSEGLRSQLRPSEIERQEDSSLGVDRLSVREGSQLVPEPSEATALATSHHAGADQPRDVGGSGQSTHIWILRRNRPRRDWVLWSGVNLGQESLQSILAAVKQHSELSSFGSLEIKLETTNQSFTFQSSAENADHFEEMKRFMGYIIETSSREKDSEIGPNIYIAPTEHI